MWLWAVFRRFAVRRFAARRFAVRRFDMRWRAGLRALLISLALVSSLPVNAAPRLVLDDSAGRYNLAGYTDVLVVAEPVDINQLTNTDLAQSFRPSALGDFTLDPAQAQTWLRFTLYNPADRDQRRLLSVQPHKLSHHRVYADGDAVAPLATQATLRPQHIYPIDLPAGATRQFHVSSRSDAPLQLSLSLYSYEGLMSKLGRQNFFNAAMLGVVVALALYSLLASLAYREALFALVAFYCVVMAIGQSYAWGYLGGRVEGMLPPWENKLMPLLCQLVMLTELVFALGFPIVAANRSPSPWRRVLRAALVINIVGMLIYGIGDIAIMTTLSNVLTASTLLLLPIVALYGYLHTDSRLVLYYLFVRGGAFAVYVITWLSYNLELIDESQTTVILTLATVLVAAAHVALLLARRAKREQKRHHEAQRIALMGEANRVRSETLARVTHDIRTPISAILGVADLLEDTHLNHNQREYLHTLQRSSHELLQLLEEAGQAARYQDSGSELDPEPTDLAELIESTLTGFRNMTAEYGVELISDIAPKLPPRVLADPSRLKQLLTHAVISAFEHSEGGEILLRAGGRAGRIWFDVKHRGRPFDRQERLALSQRRSDGDDYNSRFAIIAQLVQAMGGQIHLTGGGDRQYRIYFDLALEPARDDDSTTHATPLLQGRRILVVNPHHTFCKVIDQQCQRWGMEVFVAHSEQSALAQLHNQALLDRRMDFLLIDSGFSDRGLTLAQRLLDASGDDAPRPCCLLTAFADTQFQRQELQGAGVQRVLSKPVGSGALHNALCGEQHAANTKSHTLSTYSSDSLSPRPMHCLMAEDNPTNAQVLKRMLKALNISVRHVENGQQAVTIFMREHFDFVVMDIEMPILDGEEATRQIRQFEADERRERTPVFGLTANAMDEQRDRYLRAGMDLHLVKPIRLWELAEAIKRWTGYHREQG